MKEYDLPVDRDCKACNGYGHWVRTIKDGGNLTCLACKGLGKILLGDKLEIEDRSEERA